MLILPQPPYRALRGDYGLHNRPTMPAIGKIVKTFEETGVIINIERPVDHRFARSAENIAIVSENDTVDPNVSLPRRSYVLMLHLDLHLHPYKVQLTQQLKPADHSQHLRILK